MAATTQDGTTPTLFDAEIAARLGPSRFRPTIDQPVVRRLPKRSEAKLREAVREHAPRRPGIYVMLDAKERIIYVGKAKALRTRLLSYFRKGHDPKCGRILSQTRTLLWEEARDEFAALLRELELIRRFRPKFNVIGQPGSRRYAYLCLGKSPAPYAYLTANPTGKEVACYGPLVGRGQIDDAIRRLNDYFGLRDCSARIPMIFADQLRLFPHENGPKCLRHEIDSCLGPCAGLCSRRQYAGKVRKAKAFLDGRDDAILKDLTLRMTAASEALRFEQATSLRDRLKLLTWLDDRLTFLRGVREGGAVIYPLQGINGETVRYLILQGEVIAVVREETNDATIRELFRLGQTSEVLTHRTADSILLVNAWFRKHPEAMQAARAAS